MKLDREAFEKQAARAKLESTFQSAPVTLYAIREAGVVSATIVGHAITSAYIELVRSRGGACRHVCTFPANKLRSPDV